MPSEYARTVFDGPNGMSHLEHDARFLAQRRGAVTAYRRFRTGMGQAYLSEAKPVLEEHLCCSKPYEELTPQQASRRLHNSVSFPQSSDIGKTPQIQAKGRRVVHFHPHTVQTSKG